ncbi:MAG: hypothetical protein JKY62_16865 [Desulfocapsa sp.]|nr:hypothetical protein [Desulfocapsa sp.]
MAVTHPTAVRNLIANLVVDQLDLGSGTAEGKLVFNTSGDSEVATLDLANPAFGAAASGIATAGTIVDDTTATGGTTAKCRLIDRDAGIIIEGSVTLVAGGGDIELSSVVIGAGDTVSMTSLTYAAPA